MVRIIKKGEDASWYVNPAAEKITMDYEPLDRFRVMQWLEVNAPETVIVSGERVDQEQLNIALKAIAEGRFFDLREIPTVSFHFARVEHAVAFKMVFGYD